MPKLTLKAARVNVGLTQRQVAEKTGISERKIIDWENGRNIGKMNWDELKSLLHIYDISADYLFLPKENGLTEI